MAKNPRWVNGSWVNGSWVTSPMGHMGHGSQKVTHCQLWGRVAAAAVGAEQQREQPAVLLVPFLLCGSRSGNCHNLAWGSMTLQMYLGNDSPPSSRHYSLPGGRLRLTGDTIRTLFLRSVL